MFRKVKKEKETSDQEVSSYIMSLFKEGQVSSSRNVANITITSVSINASSSASLNLKSILRRSKNQN